MKPEEIVPTHGAAGANHHIFYSLLEPGDRVISIMPTYQQLYSIPESYGADVKMLHLKAENGYLPDLEELKKLAVPGTKMICINNPNNPTGALMRREFLSAVCLKYSLWRTCGWDGSQRMIRMSSKRVCHIAIIIWSAVVCLMNSWQALP